VHNSSAKLVWDGGSLTKQADIRKRVEECLGMTIEVFRETCFVGQGKFLDVVDAPHSERLAYFSRVCGTAKAEVIREIIQKGVNQLPVLSDRSEEILTGESRLKSTQEGITDLKNAHVCTLASITEQRQAYTEALKIAATQSEEVYQSKVTKATEDLTLARIKLDTFNKENNLVEVSAVSKPSEEDELKHTSYKLLPDVKKKYQTAKEAYEQYVIKVPVKVNEVEEVLVNSLEADRTKLNELAQQYKMAKEGVCPTCKREYTLSEDPKLIIAAYDKLNKEVSDKATSIKLKREQYLKYKLELQTYTTRAETLKTAMDNAASEVKLLEDSIAEFDVKVYWDQKMKYAEYMEYLVKSQKLQTLTNTLKVDIEKKEEALNLILETPYITAIQLKEANEIIREFSSLSAKLTHLDADIRAQERLLLTYTSDLRIHKEAQEKYVKILSVRRELELCRDVLHRDNLPKLVMRRLLVALNLRISNYLEQFRTNYAARLDDEFDFVCDFTNGQFNKSAKQLSGGQKVALALAFRFALSDVLGSSVPLLILDEPTVFLDDANVESVRDVLDNVRKYVERGTFVLISTHATELRSGFTRVVELTESNG
jgi:DNA repair exonuclease SbcCD ATPase subunit